jgi:hypothetical protein
MANPIQNPRFEGRPLVVVGRGVMGAGGAKVVLISASGRTGRSAGRAGSG